MPTTFTLTTGNDPFVGTSGDDTVNGLSTTLTAGDTLDGAGGHDTLQLFGGGTFDLSALAQFTGFEEVSVTNITGGASNLTLANGSDLTVTIDNEVGSGGTIRLADGDVALNLAAGSGHYTVNGSTGAATIDAGGNDGAYHLSSGTTTITGVGRNYSEFYLGSGDTTITGGGNYNYFELGSGQSTITTGSDYSDIYLGSGDAVIHGHNQASIFVGATDGALDLDNTSAHDSELIFHDSSFFQNNTVSLHGAIVYSRNDISISLTSTLDLSALNVTGLWTLNLNDGGNGPHVVAVDSSLLSHFVSISGNPIETLRTASTALDLTHTTVTTGTILSTNATGTTFTAADVTTGLHGGGTLVDHNDGTWTYTPAANDDTAVSFTYTAGRRVADTRWRRSHRGAVDRDGRPWRSRLHPCG